VYTQLADKGLNNDSYNYKGGIFPIGGNTAFFVQLLNIQHNEKINFFNIGAVWDDSECTGKKRNGRDKYR